MLRQSLFADLNGHLAHYYDLYFSVPRARRCLRYLLSTLQEEWRPLRQRKEEVEGERRDKEEPEERICTDFSAIIEEEKEPPKPL